MGKFQISFRYLFRYLFHLWLLIHNNKLLNTARRTTKLIWNEQHVLTGNDRRWRMRIRFAAVFLWPCPVRDSRTSRNSAHVQSQVWQIWLVLVSIYCVYKAIQNRNVVGLGQMSRFLVLTKRSAASRDGNGLVTCQVIDHVCSRARPPQSGCKNVWQ